MQSKLIIPTRNYKNVKKQQDYCSVGIYEKESGLYDTKVVFANRFISIVYVLNGRKVIT